MSLKKAQGLHDRLRISAVAPPLALFCCLQGFFRVAQVSVGWCTSGRLRLGCWLLQDLMMKTSQSRSVSGHSGVLLLNEQVWDLRAQQTTLRMDGFTDCRLGPSHLTPRSPGLSAPLPGSCTLELCAL